MTRYAIRHKCKHKDGFWHCGAGKIGHAPNAHLHKSQNSAKAMLTRLEKEFDFADWEIVTLKFEEK